MNMKHMVMSGIETVMKVLVLVVAVIFVYGSASTAYDFGYRVFANEPISKSGGRTITVVIGQEDSVKDIANMLQDKGLIEDGNLFVVQELLSEYHGKIVSGMYDLSTVMTADEMLAVMSTEATAESTE